MMLIAKFITDSFFVSVFFQEEICSLNFQPEMYLATDGNFYDDDIFIFSAEDFLQYI